MNPNRFVVHEIDTSKGSALTLFDGSNDDESKLAKQFWSSVLLTPPVESTLVCKEIKQRIKSQTNKSTMTKQRFSNGTSKPNKENSSQKSDYEEMIALHRAKEEAKQIEMTNERKRSLRQLFYEQAKLNRLKSETWSLPPSRNYFESNHQYQYNEVLLPDEENDRDLVRSLPD